MNITAKNTDEVSVRLTIKVEESDYKDKVIAELKKIGKTHQIPGFRKGHVALSDLQRRFGHQVTSDVINDEVYHAVMKYIEDNKLNVLGSPMPVEVKELDLKNNKEFTFEFDLAIAPELHVEVNKDMVIPYYNIEVTDSMIDEQDKAFRKRFGAQVPGEEFEEDALVKGFIKQLNADGTVKEGEDAIQVENGIVAPMYFVDKTQAEKFVGKKPGDTVVFNPATASGDNVTELASMLNVSKERAATATGDFEITISEIIVVRLAEHNDEFFTNVFGADKVHNEEEYRQAVKEMIQRELAQNSDMYFRQTARKVFVDKYGDMKLPDEILKSWLISRNKGLNAENIDEEYKSVREDLKWQLIKEDIASLLKLSIEEEDLLAFAKVMAARQFAQYGMTNIDDETITRYAKNIIDDKEFRPRLFEQVGDAKLYSAVKNAVTLSEEEVSLDKFKEMVGAE